MRATGGIKQESNQRFASGYDVSDCNYETVANGRESPVATGVGNDESGWFSTRDSVLRRAVSAIRKLTAPGAACTWPDCPFWNIKKKLTAALASYFTQLFLRGRFSAPGCPECCLMDVAASCGYRILFEWLVNTSGTDTSRLK